MKYFIFDIITLVAFAVLFCIVGRVWFDATPYETFAESYFFFIGLGGMLFFDSVQRL